MSKYIPIKPKPYARLRDAIKKAGFSVQQLADAIHMSYQSLCYRLCGYTEWSLNDVYDVCKALRISPAAVEIYFPRGGFDEAV